VIVKWEEGTQLNRVLLNLSLVVYNFKAYLHMNSLS